MSYVSNVFKDVFKDSIEYESTLPCEKLKNKLLM